MKTLTELQAEDIIKEYLPKDLKGFVIEVVKRDALSRLEHQAVFAVIFKHNKKTALEVVQSVKKLSLDEPKITFSGSEVDEKFDLENSAVFITAICK